MTFSLRPAGLTRTITTCVAALVLAASAAPAFAASSASSVPRLSQPCADVALPECERQVLASRGIGAPASAASAAPVAEPAPSSDAGFDWNAAAVGAVGMAGLLLVGLLTMIASRRRRLRRIGYARVGIPMDRISTAISRED